MREKFHWGERKIPISENYILQILTYWNIIIYRWIDRKRGQNMIIKGAKTIAEYKQIQTEKIQNWIDSNFVEGSVVWEMDGLNAIKVTDKTCDSMVVSLDEIR